MLSGPYTGYIDTIIYPSETLNGDIHHLLYTFRIGNINLKRQRTIATVSSIHAALCCRYFCVIVVDICNNHWRTSCIRKYESCFSTYSACSLKFDASSPIHQVAPNPIPALRAIRAAAAS